MPVPLFRSMKRVPGVSTISTGPTLNPGGCRLTEIIKDKSLRAVKTPALRGNRKSRRGRRSCALQKQDHLLGESARLSITFS